MIFQIKDWLKTLNQDPDWQDKIEKARSYEKLEEVIRPIVSEIGWLNLEGLDGILTDYIDNILRNGYV